MPDRRELVRTPFLEPSPLDRYRKIENLRTRRLDQAILVSEGDAGIDSNYAAVFGPISVEHFQKEAREFFHDQPYAVAVESETATDAENHLKATGWKMDEDEVAMILASSPELPIPPDELDIVRVATDDEYEDYMQIVPGNRSWVPDLAAATDPGVGLFVGYVAGQPVATARIVCYGPLAEINAVQTLEQFRRRGYGRAMTSRAVADARNRGCNEIMLTATEMGYPLYLGMGFETVCNYRTYLPPETG